MIRIELSLSNAQAEAVLKSDGLSAGWGIRKSKALQQAEKKLLDTIQSAWNDALKCEHPAAVTNKRGVPL